MKIGTRITLITVTLVLATLGIYGYLNVRDRRIEITRDLEKQTLMVGTAVRVAIEAAIEDGLFSDLGSLFTRWQKADPTIALTYADFSQLQPNEAPRSFVYATNSLEAPRPDAERTERIRRLRIDAHEIGEHLSSDGKSYYALTLPIFDQQHRLVGAVDLVRSATDADLAFERSWQRALYAAAGLGAMLVMLTLLSARGVISNPLKRLVEAIDDVTHGDLGRVILRERDDEIGDLAERFNEMTGSLRAARAEILENVDTKLALEARLRHSEKLATIGQLAAGIAHEVGTPLNVIGGRARTMEKKANDPAEVAKNAGIIAAQTQRITKIIEQLLDFARRPASERTEVDLSAVAVDCLEFLEHQLMQSHIDAAVRPFTREGDGAAQKPLVIADGDQVQQVCINLCVNAIQAMPDGGALSLSTRAIRRRRPGLEETAPSNYIELDVEDTGVGIPEGDRERIFEPFYSTKGERDAEGRPAGGTGLGLAVSVGIVKDHDGWIEIDNRSGGGTIFRVFLPAAESPDEAVRRDDGP